MSTQKIITLTFVFPGSHYLDVRPQTELKLPINIHFTYISIYWWIAETLKDLLLYLYSLGKSQRERRRSRRRIEFFDGIVFDWTVTDDSRIRHDLDQRPSSFLSTFHLDSM